LKLQLYTHSTRNLVSEIDIKSNLPSIVYKTEWRIGERVRRCHDASSLDLFQRGFGRCGRGAHEQHANSYIHQGRPVRFIQWQHRFISVLRWRHIYGEAPPVMPLHQTRRSFRLRQPDLPTRVRALSFLTSEISAQRHRGVKGP